MFSKLFKSGSSQDVPAASLYRAIVHQARSVPFYADLGVPDTVDGRFEMIALHMFLILHRLKNASQPELGQTLFDTMFADMDRSLREMGAGDLGVGRRVRAMAEGLYGRIAAYEAGLAEDDAELALALRRNLLGTLREPEPSDAALKGLARYLRAAVAHLAAQDTASLIGGNVSFPPPPTRAA